MDSPSPIMSSPPASPPGPGNLTDQPPSIPVNILPPLPLKGTKPRLKRASTTTSVESSTQDELENVLPSLPLQGTKPSQTPTINIQRSSTTSSTQSPMIETDIQQDHPENETPILTSESTDNPLDDALKMPCAQVNLLRIILQGSRKVA